MMIGLMTTLLTSAFLFVFIIIIIIIISFPLYNNNNNNITPIKFSVVVDAAAAAAAEERGRGSFISRQNFNNNNNNEKIEAIKRISKMIQMTSSLSSSSIQCDHLADNNHQTTCIQQQQQQQLINDLTILLDDNNCNDDGFFNEYKIQSIILSTATTEEEEEEEEENNESSMIVESTTSSTSTIIDLEEKQQQQEKAVCSISKNNNNEEDLVILEKKSPVNNNNNNNNIKQQQQQQQQHPLLLLEDNNDERYYADRHAKGILKISQDDDCLNREFDYATITTTTSSDSDVDVVNEMIQTLQKCRILVIRNLFSSSSIIEKVLPKYSQYVSDIDSGKISTSLGGTATNHGGEYFVLKEDTMRNNYLATKELIELSTQQQKQQPSSSSSSSSSSSQQQQQQQQQQTQFLNHPLLLRILRSPKILGSETILNHVGIINAKRQKKKKKKKKKKQKRKNKPQYWHMDGKYVPNTDDDDDDDQGFHHHSGVAGHDLPPFAINMFTPLSLNITSIEYGPTEFCLGTSYMKGNDLVNDLPIRDGSLLRQQDGIVEKIQEFEWSVHHSNNNNKAVCPDHLHRIPLLNIGDVVLFDYMLTHRGGANLSNETDRSMIFAMYSRKWYRDTTFDIPTKREIQQERKIGGDFSFLTKLTRYAIPPEAED